MSKKTHIKIHKFIKAFSIRKYKRLVFNQQRKLHSVICYIDAMLDV